MAAFSLLGKRASFVTQGPGTIIRCFSCPSCSHRNGLTLDWGFLFCFICVWGGLFCFCFCFDYLASFAAYFCILSVWEASYLAPNLEELERMVNDCCPSKNKDQRCLNVFLWCLCMCRFTHPYIQDTYLFDTLFIKMYIWCTFELHVDALGEVVCV